MAIEIGDDPDTREWAMHMILVARALERIGDNAVDIGEQVAFVVTGLFREFSDSSHPAGARLGRARPRRRPRPRDALPSARGRRKYATRRPVNDPVTDRAAAYPASRGPTSVAYTAPR